MKLELSYIGFSFTESHSLINESSACTLAVVCVMRC